MHRPYSCPVKPPKLKPVTRTLTGAVTHEWAQHISMLLCFKVVNIYQGYFASESSVLKDSFAMCSSDDESQKIDSWISPIFTLCDEALQKLRTNGDIIFKPVVDPDNLWREREVFIPDGDTTRKIGRMCKIYQDKVLSTGKALITRVVIW